MLKDSKHQCKNLINLKHIVVEKDVHPVAGYMPFCRVSHSPASLRVLGRALAANIFCILLFTALHGMQTRSSD